MKGQTVGTLIRLLLQEQSDLGLCCLFKHISVLLHVLRIFTVTEVLKTEESISK